MLLFPNREPPSCLRLFARDCKYDRLIQVNLAAARRAKNQQSSLLLLHFDDSYTPSVGGSHRQLLHLYRLQSHIPHLYIPLNTTLAITMHLSIASSLALLLTLVAADDTASAVAAPAAELSPSSPSPSPYLDPAIWRPIATITHSITTATPSQTPPSAALLDAAYKNAALPDSEKLDLREIVDSTGATIADSDQTSPITTIWLNGVEVVYTQLFSAVPDQWSSAQSGAIGYGTLSTEASKNKRAAATDVPEVVQRSDELVERLAVSEHGSVMGKRDAESGATSIIAELFVTGLGMGVGIFAGVGIFLAI